MTFLLFIQSSLASQPSGIKELVNNYQYALEVEWDQKDEAFLAQQEQLLNDGLFDLMEKGQSPQYLLEEVLKDIPDKQFKNDVTQALLMSAQQELSAQELQEMILASAFKNQKQGTSWSPLVIGLVGVGVALIVARLAVEIYFHEWGKRL